MSAYIRFIKNIHMVWRLFQVLLDNRPRGATGLYITSTGVMYGRRTNRHAAPKNYFFFEEAES